MLWHKDLVLHIAYSMSRFFTAFGIAVALAVPVGLLMGWNLKIRAFILPLWQLLSPIPQPARVPMTIILFGIGSKMHIFLMFMGLVMLLIGESYGGRIGIGCLLGQAKDYFVIPEMMVCMVILGWIG
jgi:ABC-type nitrate/sulfonate/bicarbonate transport system permease component